MRDPVKVLVVEDSEDDALLLIRELERGGFAPQWRLVETAGELEDALDEGSWDVILADYRMPELTGAEALAIVRGRNLDTPFIVVSGTVGEETAVEMMRNGANDYFLKGSLRLLPGAVARELREAQGRAEARENEERLRSLYENSAVGMYRTTPDGRIILANSALVRMLGYDSLEELAARNLEKDGYDPGYPRSEYRRRIEADGAVLGLESAWVRKDGSTVSVRESARAFFDTEGRPLYYEGTVEDISDRKRAEDELRAALEELAARERRLETIVATEPECVKVLDTDGNLVEMNPAGLAMIEADSLEEVRGHAVVELVAPEHRKAFRKFFEAVMAGEGRRLEFELLGLRGARRWVDTHSVPLRDGEGAVTGLLGVTRDVTERVRAERELRESEERYRDLVEKAGIAILVDDLEGRVVFANQRCGELFGYSQEEFREKSISELAHPQERERVMALHGAHTAGGDAPWSYISRGIHRDGRTLHLAVDVTPLVRDDRIEGTRSYIHDVTAEHELQEQLLQAQKMESVGRLAGGVAHDFNNILQAILMHADVALGGLGSSLSPETHLREIRAAADRAAALTRQLLAFSRREELQARRLDLNELVGGTLRMLRRVIGENIEIVFRPGAGGLWLEGDQGQLEQVVMNLVVNARDAMPRGGRLTISTAMAAGAGDEPQVELTVSDTGCGMDEATRQRIFEPFFTTKDRERGTGLGLATAYGVVGRHGGAFRVESEPGAGSTFTVLLPAVGGPAGPGEVEAAGEVPGGSETVLVAEDDPAVRDVLVGILDGAGYTVLVAEDGDEAVALFDERQGEVAMVILDAIMPRKDGTEALAEIRRVRPGVPALFSTGYSGGALGSVHALPEDVGIIEKPYTVSDLLVRVRQVLDGRETRTGQ